jgi:Flp pilus assembly protein TadG
MFRNNVPTKSERGQSLVEFGVSLVILMVLLAGLVDASRALFTFMAMREAAQEGALYGSLQPGSISTIQTRTLGTSNLIQSLSDELDVDVTVGEPICTGSAITVRVTYANFPITMPFLGTVLGSQSVPISASITDTILSPSCTTGS